MEFEAPEQSSFPYSGLGYSGVRAVWKLHSGSGFIAVEQLLLPLIEQHLSQKT